MSDPTLYDILFEDRENLGKLIADKRKAKEVVDEDRGQDGTGSLERDTGKSGEA